MRLRQRVALLDPAHAAHPARDFRIADVVDVRGAGVIWGLELDRPAAPVVDAALERGLLINRTADTVLRLLPPYIVDSADVNQMAVLLDAALAAVKGERS